MDCVHNSTSAVTFGSHSAPNDPSAMYSRPQPTLRRADAGYTGGCSGIVSAVTEAHAQYDISKRTQSPIVTGTSVLAMACQDGVILAADTLGSYGSLARFRAFQRIKKVNDRCIVGATGDLSDFQAICEMLDEMVLDNKLEEDGAELQPKEIHSYLSRVLYNRRNKGDPLWNYLVVAGMQESTPFLGLVDLVGTTYEDNLVATGYGAYIAIPLLRNAQRPDITLAEASKVVEDAMRVLIYRECRSVNNIQFATVNAGGAEIRDPVKLETDWTVGNRVSH